MKKFKTKTKLELFKFYVFDCAPIILFLGWLFVVLFGISYGVIDSTKVYDCKHYENSEMRNVPAKCFSNFISDAGLVYHE